MNPPRATYLDPSDWPSAVAGLILNAVTQTRLANGTCSVMLTGGRSAAQVYAALAPLPEFGLLRDIRFYFSDERCVPPDHPESNYALVMRTLFQRGVPTGCEVIRMTAEQADRKAAAAAYAAKLPDRLDVLLLSVGEDGHIASLFPNSEVLVENRCRVVPVAAPKPPPERLTVIPRVFMQAAQKFVMALGPAKSAVFQQALADPQDIASLPARLVLNATWLLDTRLPD